MKTMMSYRMIATDNCCYQQRTTDNDREQLLAMHMRLVRIG